MKKLFTLFVSLWMAMASLFAANMTGGEVFYLTPHTTWNSDNARYAIYFFNNSTNQNTWVSMTKVEGESNLWKGTTPSGNWANLIFCRMNPSATANNWNNNVYWGGQTQDLTWDGTKNHYTVNSSKDAWNKPAGTWSLYVVEPVITVGAAPEFATTTVGETSSATVTYTLENADKAEATIEGEGFSIAEQSVGSVTITFAPEAEGEYTGTLTITSGDVKETVDVKATAVAPEAPKVPEILHVSAAEFAEIMEGETTSVTVTYELVNAEEATATVEGEGFAITAQETGSVTIEFAPATAGEYTGKLIIAAGEVVKEVALAATAKKAPVIVTISFVNPDWTNANLYAWVDGGANLTGGSWPGLAMTKGENGKFTYDLEIPEDGVYKFIINNGNGVQSVDMPGVTESTCYILGAKVDTKYQLAVSENCEFEVAPEPDPIDPYVAIRGTMTNWDMAKDIKMTFNETANEWSITKFAIEAGGKFKVVSVNEKSEAAWYGSDKVDLQEGLINAGQGDGDIDLGAGTYDIYFKVAEGRIWIQKYVEPTPEPEPIDPYAAIRGLGEGTEEEAWSEAAQIKLELNAEAESEEWFIQGLEIAEGQAFKVVYVNAKSETSWYGATAVEANEELGAIGEDNITLAAGKYDIYFKVAAGTMWIAPVKAEEPEPEPLPVVITFVDEITFPKTFVGETTNDIIEFTLENAPEDAEVVVEVTGDAFSVAEVQDNFIYLAFAPEAEGEYAGVLTVTVGEVSESLEFTAVASPVEVEPEPVELEFALVGRLNGDNDNEILDYEEGYKFTKESDTVYTLNITFTGTVEGKNGAQVQKVKLVDAEGNIWARDSGSKQIEAGNGTSTMVNGETASSTYLVTEVGVEYKITFTLETESKGQITFEKVETPVDPEPEPEPEPEPDPTPEFPKTITIKVAAAWEGCNLWAWYQDGSGNLFANWPGEAMVKGEDGFYALDIEINGPVSLIASYGSAQTGDYTAGVSESTCFNVEDGALVLNADCTYEEPTLSEPYYGIRGLDGAWKAENDVKLAPNAEGTEWFITGLEVDGTQEFKVVNVDATGVVLGWYGAEAVEANEALGNIGTDNIKLAAGAYDIYFKVYENKMWIQPASPSTDAEEAIAELIYAIDGTIYAPAPFAIIDLAGKDVTNANGALEGAYIVKTQNSVTKVLVK